MRSSSFWDESDIARRLCSSLDVAARVVREIASTGYRHPNDPEAEVSGPKIVAETAMLLLAASASGSSNLGVRERIDAVAELLVPLARGDSAKAGLCLNPA